MQELTNGKQTEKVRTLYFDFENEWRVKVSSTNELSTEDAKFGQYIERELVPQRSPEERRGSGRQ